jgi:hypothetical protein
MASVQSSIRAEVNCGASPVPKKGEAYSAYAIASANELIPEMENAARLTLDVAMTFETLGEGLRLFEGRALHDLINFRKRCRDGFIACLDSFLKVQPPGPSSIWVGCPEVMIDSAAAEIDVQNALPRWLNQLLSRNRTLLIAQKFTDPVDIHSRIRREYFTALHNHATCNFCSGVHMRNGSTFCTQLENKFADARDKVLHSLLLFKRREPIITPCRYL